ncbi:cytochrome c3 family protein [Sutterella sp.]|uniref:cytochrome c3 family protein n=1 Tax=Sutterella sp. TaxID=1981025 RepID=UPI0026DF58FB|nr:cytochrome c3 family protein [Sutterella sp.]MDO5530991.1 cytochrome c3 family protein [Sutterella sp.]
MTKKTLIALAAALALGSAFTSATAADFTADFHVSKGLNCATCHKTAPVEGAKVKKATCQSCHSYESLAQKTAKVEPNPHYNHLGDVNCTDCHKGHQKSELMCNQCHQFQLNVPHSK